MSKNILRVPKSVKTVLFRLQGTRSSWSIHDGEIYTVCLTDLSVQYTYVRTIRTKQKQSDTHDTHNLACTF